MFSLLGVIGTIAVTATIVDGIRGNQKVKDAYATIGKSLKDTGVKTFEFIKGKVKKDEKPKTKSKKKDKVEEVIEVSEVTDIIGEEWLNK